MNVFVFNQIPVVDAGNEKAGTRGIDLNNIKHPSDLIFHKSGPLHVLSSFIKV